MKNNKITGKVLLFSAMILVSFGCSQDEGYGGSAHIKGKIMVNYYNEDFSQLLSDKPVPATDEDVYLIFGKDSVIGDKTTTSNTGNFEYNYLWPGNYKLYFYSDDTTSSLPKKVPVVKEIELGKGETYVIDDLLIKKKLDWNDGSSLIKGTIMVVNYKNSSSYPNLLIKDVTPAQEQEVYITYGNHLGFDDRIRTSSDGTFVFNNLIKGKYRIFVYSENVEGSTEKDVRNAYVEITKNNSVDSISVDYFFNKNVKTDTIYIEKL